MQSSDIGLLTIVLLLGIMIGVVGTMGAYHAVADRQSEAEQKEADEAVRAAQEERDQLQAKINEYLESERAARQAAEQGGAEEVAPRPAPAAPAQPPVAAAPRQDAPAPKNEEVLPTPREDGAKPAAKPRPAANAGFGPPRDFGAK